VAVVIIAVALLVPQGVAAIPLNVDYVVGEKMIYDSTVTASLQVHNSTTQPSMAGQLTNVTSKSTQSIEVTDFDGEYYTLNRTTAVTFNDKPYSYSMIEKMHKTGYSTYVLNLGNTTQEVPTTSVTSSSFLAQLLNKPEVKVGDTIHVSYPGISENMQMTGDLTVTFGGIEDLTTPAGTYRVFKIDITSNDLSMTYKAPAGNPNINIPTEIKIDYDMNYQIYLEYGTLREIKSTIQQTALCQSSIMTYTGQTTMEMTLNQHIKP
jgi:hypothetical protein